MKRLIAFSSVAHMGFVMLGIATLTDFGINAAIFGMVAHGLITGMLFFLAGSMQERYGTREISRLGGLLTQAPHLGWILGLLARWRRSACPASPGSGASSRRSCRPTTRRCRTGCSAARGTLDVPHLHGDRRHRHRARRRLPALDVPAGRVRQAEARVRATPTSTTSHVPEWIAWTPLLVAHRRARHLPGPHLQDHRPARSTHLVHGHRRGRCRCS